MLMLLLKPGELNMKSKVGVVIKGTENHGYNVGELIEITNKNTDTCYTCVGYSRFNNQPIKQLLFTNEFKILGDL